MNMKALKRQLAAAIAMVVVAAVSLSSATFAWFVTNNKVDATTTTIGAQSNAAFMTITNGSSGASTVNTTSVTTNVSTKSLYPATFGEESGSTKGTFMTGYGTDLETGTLTGDLKSIGTPANAVTEEYALQQVFNISSKGQNLTDLKVESIETASTAGSGQLLTSALRVLVTDATGTNWVVYGMNSGETAYEIKLSSGTSDGDVTLGNVTAGEDTVVNVYLYYEGSDVNIMTSNLQDGKLNASQSVTVHFTATADNQ